MKVVPVVVSRLASTVWTTVTNPSVMLMVVGRFAWPSGWRTGLWLVLWGHHILYAAAALACGILIALLCSSFREELPGGKEEELHNRVTVALLLGQPVYGATFIAHVVRWSLLYGFAVGVTIGALGFLLTYLVNVSKSKD